MLIADIVLIEFAVIYNYPPAHSLAVIIMQKWKCSICGWIYDPETGVESDNIEPGKAWEDVDDEFRCPKCGAVKKWFQPLE